MTNIQKRVAPWIDFLKQWAPFNDGFTLEDIEAAAKGEVSPEMAETLEAVINNEERRDPAFREAERRRLGIKSSEKNQPSVLAKPEEAPTSQPDTPQARRARGEITQDEMTRLLEGQQPVELTSGTTALGQGISDEMRTIIEDELIKIEGKESDVANRKRQSLEQLLNGEREPSAFEQRTLFKDIEQQGPEALPTETPGTDEEISSLVDQMLNGEIQPRRSDFDKVFKEEGFEMYKDALNTWREKQREAAAPPETPTGTGTTDPTTTDPNAPVALDPNALAMKTLNDALASGQISQAEYNTYKAVVDNTQIGEEFDPLKVIPKLNEIKNSTIDPANQAVVDAAIADIQSSLAFQTAQREREEEVEKANAGQTIRQSRAGLEQAGLTFSGEAVQQLGAESALARPGTESAIPTQEDFGGLFAEGTVNQANRLLSSSSAARARQNRQILGRQAEDFLGSGRAVGLNIPGFTAVGNQLGTAEQNRLQTLASTFSNLASAQDQNVAMQPALRPFTS